MKILFLASDVFLKGGIQRYSRYQIQALRDLPEVEHVKILSLWNKDQKNSFEGQFPVDYAGTGAGLLSKIKFTLRAIAAAGPSNAAEKPDLVIVNHIGLAPVASLIKKLFRIPYVLNIYGLEIWSGIGPLERKALRGADRVIGDCHFILDYINRHGVAEDRKRMLYDCVDTERFVPSAPDDEFYARYGLSKDARYIVTVGRLDRDKGQASIIKSLPHLPADVQYLLVGGGSNRDRLEALAVTEGVAARTVFAGRVPEEDLPRFYNAATLVALISRFDNNEGEGLPLGLIEASACEKPILAGTEDGSVDAVRDNRNGFLVSPRSQEEIQNRLAAMLGDTEDLRRMGKEGRVIALEEFSYPAFRKTLSSIIAEVV